MILIFMSHDIDWPKHGPSKDHILARKERFDSWIIEKVIKESYNPYYNIPDLMELEEKFNIRSTFFFRPYYNDFSDIYVYEDDVKELIKKGWEFAIHLDRVNKLAEIIHEKKIVEEVMDSTQHDSR